MSLKYYITIGVVFVFLLYTLIFGSNGIIKYHEQTLLIKKYEINLNDTLTALNNINDSVASLIGNQNGIKNIITSDLDFQQQGGYSYINQTNRYNEFTAYANITARQGL